MPRQPVGGGGCPAGFHVHDDPRCNEAAWLWAAGREDEAGELDSFVEFGTDELAIWLDHREAIVAEWHKEHPGTKPPIQRRLEEQRKYRAGRD